MGGGETSLWNSLTSSLEVKLLTILGEEDGCEESWLVPLTRILTTSHVSPGSHSILAHTYYSRLGSLSSQSKSDYYWPFSVVYNFGKGFTMRCSCILRRDNLKACLYPLFFVYVYYWKFTSQILKKECNWALLENSSKRILKKCISVYKSRKMCCWLPVSSVNGQLLFIYRTKENSERCTCEPRFSSHPSSPVWQPLISSL